MTKVALYIHIPFCAVRCHYCDFNTYARLEKYFEPYVEALITEIRESGEAAGRPEVGTIFFGGGTPTVLPPALLARVLAACRDAFDVPAGAEITSEANPGTVEREHFSALREMGVNRLSMGVQSFDDDELRWLGRMHSADEAEAAYAGARAAGFANINLDFIFGLPHQDPATWQRTLRRAISLGPEHLSLYSLTVESGTPLADQVRRGLSPSPDDDLAADLFESSAATLAAAGYVQYEISNWARDVAKECDPGSHSFASIPDFACRHNLVYWRREPYLGFGAGAHSFAGERRWWNVRPVPEYIGRIGRGVSPEAGGEEIGPELARGETMMLGLRLVGEGVSAERFRSRFGQGLDETFGREIADLVRRGLLERSEDGVRLTAAARLLGNRVFAEFMP